jgi:hypothetical protein
MVITKSAPAATRVAQGEDRHRLGVLTGVAALGLDALASCAYGPEAIVLALAAAGVAGIKLTVPVTLLIVALLAVLVASYRQVIAAYPDGGGAYTVTRRNLGQRAGLVAAASLVVDYVLNVGFSVAAGVAALTSAFPALLSWTLELCLAALLVVVGINLRGVLAGGRLFAVPAAAFIGALALLIVVGLVRGHPLHPLPAATPMGMTASVGVLLVLAAFANGCAALTGIEAIANATPSFRVDRARRARQAELGLGITLGTEPDEVGAARDFQRRWEQWQPNVPLVLLDSAHRLLGPPIARYVRSLTERQVVVLVGEVGPERWWERVLFNRRGSVVARYVGRHTDAAVCRLRFPLRRATAGRTP